MKQPKKKKDKRQFVSLEEWKSLINQFPNKDMFNDIKKQHDKINKNTT